MGKKTEFFNILLLYLHYIIAPYKSQRSLNCKMFQFSRIFKKRLIGGINRRNHKYIKLQHTYISPDIQKKPRPQTYKKIKHFCV